MSKFTSTVTLDMWYRGLWEFSGPAGTVFSIPDSLYEEFNEEFGHGVIPGLVWTEIVSEGSSGITVEEIDGSPSSSGITKVVFSNGAVAISGSTATVTTSSVTGITVAEVDGNPSSSGITRLVLPNTTVSISGSTATYTPAVPASGITVAEVDGSPSSSGITTLILPNGTVAISGSSATYTAAASGGTPKYPFADNYFAETKPGSPNATYDDEFDDASGMSGTNNGLNARWAWRNQGLATATYGKAGWMTIAIPAAASTNWRMIESAALTTGTYEALLSLEAENVSGDAAGAIVISNGTTFYSFGMTMVTGAIGWYLNAWNSETAFSSAVGSLTGYGNNRMYVRYVRGTGVPQQFWASLDGIGYVKVAATNDNLTPSASKIGFGVYETKNVGTTKLHIDYLRKVS